MKTRGEKPWVCIAMVFIVCMMLCPLSLEAQSQRDSASISGSPEIGNMQNLLIERIQEKEGSFFRNDFVRDYSPFDERTFSFGSEPSFAQELLYRQGSEERAIAVSMKENSVSATLKPLLGGSFFGSEDGLPYWTRSYGLAVSGSVGTNVVFYGKAIENVEHGQIQNIDGGLSSQPAYAMTSITPNAFDFGDVEYQLGFRFELGQLFIEKIRNTWGYGRGGQLVLSQRAPSYPQIRASIQLLHNLKFTVLAGYLDAHLNDPNSIFTDYPEYMYLNFREADHQKYIFAHVLEYSPWDCVNLAAGEEMIVSDRFAPEYLLLPVAFYHNLYIQGGGLDQTNIWGAARYTSPGLGTAYATLYIDDFNSSEGFYDVGGTLGATVIDIGHRNLDATVEFTAITPFVYSNNNTALYRTNDGYPLGDWLGQNAERAQVWLDYRPAPQFWITASYMAIRKGLPGELVQQYGPAANRSAVGLLTGPLFKRDEFALRARWEMYSGVFADVSYRLATQADQVPNRYPSFKNRSFISCALKLNIFDQNDEL